MGWRICVLWGVVALNLVAAWCNWYARRLYGQYVETLERVVAVYEGREEPPAGREEEG